MAIAEWCKANRVYTGIGETFMEKENEYLKERIAFLEALVDFQADTIKKALETTSILITHVRDKEEKVIR